MDKYLKNIGFLSIVLLFGCNTISKGQRDQNGSESEVHSQVQQTVLYNGIQLPEVWPPAIMDPKSSEPMLVPYLENPPEVIPINVGRQLFVDDFLVEKTDLTRNFHKANKYEGNPVFSPSTQYELSEELGQKAVTYLGHGGVFFEPKEGLFKMFYTAGWRGGLALATSKDLINWNRPNLGLFDENLILPKGPLWAGGDNSLWLDLNEKDTLQRYKFMAERIVGQEWKNNYSKRTESPTHTLHTSPDGKIWSQGVATGRASDYSSFFYNPFRDVWVFSIKQNTDRGRARFYSESKDFTKGANWENSVFWINADKLDKPDPVVGDSAQLYSLNVVAYESIFIGEFYIHLGPHNSIADVGNFPKITELKLGFSRDGFHWHRPEREPFIQATRKEGDWDRAYLHGTTGVMLVMDDKLWFPYTGYSGVAPDGSTGMYTGASVGMAWLRRDGFASMDGGRKEGTLLTRPLTFNGKHLFVNVDCPEGRLLVEVLDENNKPIKGFRKSDCEPIRVDKTLHKVQWSDSSDFSKLSGKSIKFRFHLTNGELYSFWVSPNENGASNGYMGAGGPGFDGVMDTKGIDID